MFSSMLVLALLAAVLGRQPAVSPQLPDEPPRNAPAARDAGQIPDFRNSRGTWLPLTGMTEIFSQDGIPWSIAYSYMRWDKGVIGKELVFIWDMETPVYKIWGPRDGGMPQHALLQRDGWTLPVYSSLMLFDLYADPRRQHIVGVTLTIYRHGSMAPVASEQFARPDP